MVEEYESDLDEETLQLDLDEVCDEVVELQNELKAAKIEAMQLRMRLKAVAPNTPTAPTTTVVPDMPGIVPQDNRLEELQNFVVWLSEHVCMEQEIILDVGLEVPIAGVGMQMGRVVQWPLTFQLGKRLYFTAPAECRDQLLELFISTKAQGKVTPESLQTLSTFWSLVPGDLETITQKASEPVVMLAQKTAPLCMLVASWPTAGALEAFRALCSVDGEPFQLGQRVEVEYEGSWYVGTLCSLSATGKASVCCDTDGPGVLTVAPVYRVRRHGVPEIRNRSISDQGVQPVFEELDERNDPPVASAKQRAVRRCQSEGNLHKASCVRRFSSAGNLSNSSSPPRESF